MASAFLNGGYSRAVPIVSSFFTVKDLQLNIREDYVEFLVAEAEVKDKFPSLLKELRKIGMIAMAKRSKFFWKLMPTLSSAIRLQIPESVVISVFKLQKQKPKNKYRQAIPALLFIATVLIVFVDGIFRSDSPLVRAHVQDPMLLAGIYTISLMGILGIHELGHLLANWKHKIKASWPYFIPAYPGGLTPTFGALIVLRSSMTNRNVMFDVGIAGPIAGLIVTIMVSIYGSTISTLITAEEAQQLTENGQLGQLFIGESALMIATVHLTGMAVENMVLVISPVLYAAWLGFLITFLNLLPAWQLDGGHLARSALGVRWHKILTYASVAILFALQLYIMAIIVLFFSSRTPANVPLDDVTPLTSKRKMLFFVALGLAVLCAPIPTTLFGLISFGP